MHYTMCLEERKTSGKLEQPSPLQAVADGITKVPRLTICDKKNGTTYLIDTGADISVIPKSLVRGVFHPTDYKLFAANNTVIRIYGCKMRVLDLGLRRPFKWSFVIAEVRQPIIGADFLAHYGLLPDLKHGKLIDQQTLLRTDGRIQVTGHTSIATINDNCKYGDLLRKYIAITRPTALTEVIHEVRHHIVTKGPPVAERPRRLAPDRYAAAKIEFETMMEQGIC